MRIITSIFVLFGILISFSLYSQHNFTSKRDSVNYHALLRLEYNFLMINISDCERDTVYTINKEDKYKVILGATCPYVEGYPRIVFEEEEFNDDFSLCSRDLFRDNSITNISYTDSIHSDENNTFYPIGINVNPRIFFNGFDCQLRSYLNGKYVIIQKSIIYQHGSQTSSGLTTSYFLERVD